ncbi:MAG TPA: folylpolyglutamate synthase/dihydrofolate synthase family protein [Prolixibacteraceae bacterium]|nr:folylpolyglutamate synthase/dihydrofolate synthase family protein [Prolixibacteraceae bacterium]
MKTYQQVLDYLYSQLPMFHRTGAAAYKANLDNTIRLDEMFNYPHKAFRSIHIAGTNGKGSVSHMLASVLQEAGYKTGLYTSPHLKDFRERIRVNGQMISEEAVVSFTESFLSKNETEKLEPSFFELTVSMAFDYFRSMEVEVAVIEVGLGGRLDSTNIITPEVSVITNISFDHMALLGNTLPLIAAEKAGIIKPHIPVVVGETAAESKGVFEEVADRNESPLIFADQVYQATYNSPSTNGKKCMDICSRQGMAYKDLHIDLAGNYQLFNVPTVLCTLDILNRQGWSLTEEAIRRGLANTTTNTGLMGRWQVIGQYPTVICDTGHNPAGIKLVVEQLNEVMWQKLHMVIGMVNDKDQTEVLSLLPANARYYFTKAAIPRAAEPEELLAKAATFNLRGECYPTVQQALSAALANAGKDDVVFVGGSTFVVAEIL